MSSSPSFRPQNAAEPVNRCPSCGSRVRPEDSWCSLCHHNLRPTASEPTFEPAPTTEPGATTKPGPGGTPSAVTGEPARGPLSLVKTGLASVERPDPAVLSEADRLIAELAAAEAERARESGFGTWSGRLGTRTGGVLLAVVGGVVLLVTGLLGLSLLGLLL